MTQGLLDEIHFFYHNAVTFPRVVTTPDIPRHLYLRHNAFFLFDTYFPVTNSWIEQIECLEVIGMFSLRIVELLLGAVSIVQNTSKTDCTWMKQNAPAKHNIVQRIVSNVHLQYAIHELIIHPSNTINYPRCITNRRSHRKTSLIHVIYIPVHTEKPVVEQG